MKTAAKRGELAAKTDFSEKISSDVKKLFKDAVRYRRHFHKNPELSLKEFKTAEFIEKELTKYGYSPTRLVNTGVVAILDSGRKGPTIMLRADMDALPINEDNRHGFISRFPGRMHACGHDAHMAMLLCLARYFRQKGIPRGKIKFCFQPGEEGSDGAGKMVRAGVLKNPKVDFAYGMHVWSPLPIGAIGIRPGACMSAVDEFEVRIIGNGGHAAYPHTATDPVLTASSIIQAVQSIVSRNVSPLKSAVLTVAAVNAGSAFNIIPPEAVFRGTVRTFDADVRKMIEARFRQIVSSVASAYGCKSEIIFRHIVPATVNDGKMSDFVREVAQRTFGKDKVVSPEPTMGGEDFSRYAEVVPSVFVWIGAQNEEVGAIYPHHHPKFNIDENALLVGMELARNVVLEYLKDG